MQCPNWPHELQGIPACHPGVRSLLTAPYRIGMLSTTPHTQLAPPHACSEQIESMPCASLGGAGMSPLAHCPPLTAPHKTGNNALTTQPAVRAVRKWTAADCSTHQSQCPDKKQHLTAVCICWAAAAVQGHPTAKASETHIVC